MSSRIIKIVWRLFALVIVCFYAGGLTAGLVWPSAVPKIPFSNVQELAAQNKITYGCLSSGSTRAFFANSNDSVYRKMNDNMNDNPNVFTKNNREGVDRVEKENGYYAFFMQSASIEYITSRYCNLTQVGGLLNSSPYGIATQKGSPWRDAISSAILELQNQGTIEMLKEKWWHVRRGGGQCGDRSRSDQVNQGARDCSALLTLDFTDLGAVFCLLSFGLFIALIVAVIEFWLKRRHIGKEKPIDHEISNELKAEENGREKLEMED